jgi:hypothetical protein
MENVPMNPARPDLFASLRHAVAARLRAAGSAAAPSAPRGPASTDTLSQRLESRVRLAVALRVTSSGEIDACVPGLPGCCVRAADSDRALAELRARVVAHLLGGGTPQVDARGERDAAPHDGAGGWTEIVIVLEGMPRSQGR